MAANLPANLISLVSDLLTPLIQQPDERDAYLIEAFYITDRLLYTQIDPNGDARPFMVRCIKKLLDRGCLADGKHALAALLDVARASCGADEQAKITKLVGLLDGLCIEQPALSTTVPITATATTQTLATPVEQRTPTVFLSYSRADSTFVERLRTDLQAAGHSCWIDTTDIKGGEEWVQAITEGINNSYAFVTVVSSAANASKWVQREYLWAEGKHKPIFPVLIADGGLPIYMINLQGIRLDPDYVAGLSKLMTALPQPVAVASEIKAVRDGESSRPVNQRALELEYLDRLRMEEWLIRAEKYTPLAVTAQIRRARDIGEPVGIRPEFEHLRQSVDEKFMPHEQETHKFSDIITAMTEIRRAVVLGEPGAGKTTTLWKLAREMVEKALADADTPIPLFVRLGKWTDANQLLTAFIATELDGLGVHLEALLMTKHAALLLDGLNEIPVAQREEKARQIKTLFAAHPGLISILTCREQDYTLDLGFDRISITPLDPLRIREFVTRYLGKERGETLFWRLAGGDEVQPVWVKWEHAGATLELFFSAPDVPYENPDVYQTTTEQDDEIWRKKVRHRGSLMVLARNPYMLLMLVEVYTQAGTLPINRGQLFASFVETLLVREGIAVRDKSTGKVIQPAEAEALLAGLARLAYEMQIRRAQISDKGNVVTVLMRAEVTPALLNEHLLYLGGSTNILGVGNTIQFSHQLLQEYFAATHMQIEIEAGRLKAADVWPPERWWERTNWEEVVILLAGLYSNDCSPILDWVADTNPEVTAQCIVRSGATASRDTLKKLRSLWMPRLTDLNGDPDPRARAAVGRALGLADLDNRPGVGLRVDGLPDIDWCEVPAGDFIYGKGKIFKLPTFHISKHPITYKQFQAFLDAPDGYENAQWWNGLHADGLKQQQDEPCEQSFKFWNHPRNEVSWYESMAFCRWLSTKLDAEITLPTEEQWEKAARGTDGRIYPYGNEFDAAKANTYETGIGQTSAVGIFPDSMSPYGVMDMSGNVWEWCLNEYESDEVNIGPSARRAVRGGSWYLSNERATGYAIISPGDRFDGIGLRVVLVGVRSPSL